MQRLQTEHLRRQQQEQQQQQFSMRNIQELQAQISKGQQLGMTGPQSLMFLPFLDQLRAPLVPPQPAAPPTSGNKHINSIANVSLFSFCHSTTVFF